MSHLRVPNAPIPCALCGTAMTCDEFPTWQKDGTHRKSCGWACRVCYNLYQVFRRAFKSEHGRFPTIAEFRSDA